MDMILSGFPSVEILDSSDKLLTNGNRIGLSGFNLSDEEKLETLKSADFIRVYYKKELRALYSYDAEKKDFKVFKML